MQHLLLPDVLIPERWILRDELPHHLDAFRVLHYFDLYPRRAERFFRAQERGVLADHNARNSVEQNRAGAHRAGRQCGVERAPPVNVGALPSGVFETIHFAVVNDAAALDPLVVPAPDDFPVQYQHRADGNSACGQTLFGFVNRGLEKYIHAAF